ncbi:hypothetical protein MKW92_012777, partial [Papaver armeniacum]
TMSNQVRPEAQDANTTVTIKVKRPRGVARSPPNAQQRDSPYGQVVGDAALTSPH